MDNVLVQGFILAFMLFFVLVFFGGELFKFPAWQKLRPTEQKLIIWGVSLVLMNLIVISLYPTLVANNAQQMMRTLAIFPAVVARVFGYHRLNLTEPLNIYALDAHFLPLVVGSIFTSILAVDLFAAQKRKPTESELSRPKVWRTSLTDALVRLISLVLVLNLLIAASTVLAFSLFIGAGYSMLLLLQLLAAPLFIHLFFISTGFSISMLLVRRTSALLVSVGLVLLLYSFKVLSYFENLMFLRFLSPFYYLSAVDIVKTGQINPVYVLIVTASSLLILTGAYYYCANRAVAS